MNLRKILVHSSWCPIICAPAHNITLVNRDEDLTEMSKKEQEDIKYLSIFENKYNDFDEKVMSVESTEELKKMEMAMTDRTNKGYYRCKVKDEQLYNDCTNAHKKHTTLEQLAMLQHDKSTQPNESMNQ